MKKFLRAAVIGMTLVTAEHALAAAIRGAAHASVKRLTSSSVLQNDALVTACGEVLSNCRLRDPRPARVFDPGQSNEFGVAFADSLVHNDVEFGCLNREQFKALNNLLRRMIECGDRAVALQDYLLPWGGIADDD